MPASVFSLRRLSLGAALLLALGTHAALAQEIVFPRLTGRIVDEANLLDAATKADLDSKLAALEAKSGDQLVVVTVRSLGGLGTGVRDVSDRVSAAQTGRVRAWFLYTGATRNALR